MKIKLKIVKYKGLGKGRYGVHEIEDEPHQGSGIFQGTKKECLQFIKDY